MEELQLRSAVDAKYKWVLEDIFVNDDSCKEAMDAADALISELKKYEGKLHAKAGRTLYEYLEKQSEAARLTEKLYVYTKMRLDEDNANALYQGLFAQAANLYYKLVGAVSFFEPELMSIEEEKINGYVKNVPELQQYQFIISQLLRLKDHILSAGEEKILALVGESLQTAKNAFTMLNNADLRFPAIKDESGKKIELTHGRYSSMLESKDRKVRKAAFTALYKTYASFKNTISQLYCGNVKADNFGAKVRKYHSALEAELSADNISVKVYNNLISTIHANLDDLGRYLKLRKKVLDVKRLHMYDLYVPIVEMPKVKYTFEEAKDIVIKAMAPMGKQYVEDMKKAFTEGWIDVYENRGKTSGAYSWGCYDSHPYVLLNWQGEINDIFTLAHELGHAMHTFYSNANQPYHYASYKIFVAEVASTVNENLLMSYMLDEAKKEGDTVKQAYLLNHYLEEFRTTVHRQTMFAEFEKKAHAKDQAGQPLTCDVMCDIYYKLNKKYYGKGCSVDKDIELEWARIPHFYNSFYVYQYATGFSAATALAAGILKDVNKEEAGATEKYLDFLKSGGSDYPLNILKKAGVDLTDSAVIQSALDVFAEKVTQMEAVFN
ncbi:MAG: oligoendopeptidase F [Clostridia bacterium]|nr:oligoendopeptidase F [Clostridia bacterium]